jgi:two-component sensor histidine kinase
MINEVFQDRFNNIWISTHESGLFFFPKTKYEFITHELPAVWRIGVDLDGNVLLSTFKGFKTFNPDNSTISRKKGFEYFDKYGPCNITSDENRTGYYIKPIGAYVNYHRSKNSTISELEPHNLHEFCRDAKNRIWINNPLGYLDSDHKFHDVQEELAVRFPLMGKIPGDTKTLICDDKNRIWLATNGQGVCVFDQARDTVYFYSSSAVPGKRLQGNALDALMQASDGRIYCGGNQGMSIIDPVTDSIRIFGLAEGLPHYQVNCFQEDNLGQIWIGTDQGLAVYKPETNQIVSYGREDGIVSDYIHFYDLFLYEDGSIVAATAQGLITFNPDDFGINKQLEAAVITDFFINNSKQDLSVYLLGKNKMELKYDERDFGFQFISPTFYKANKVKYYYHLEGYDVDWKVALPSHQAYYTNLSPGAYTFKIRVQNSDGFSMEDQMGMEILILPPWYMTFWAYIGGILIFLSAIYLFFRYKLRQALKYQNLRNKISRDLHDDVGSLLTGLTMQSELLEMQVDEKYKPVAKKIYKLGREAMSRMRDTVWAIDSSKDEVNSLIDRMKDHAQTNLDPRHIDYDFTIDTPEARLSILPDVRQQIYRIYKEAISNIAKHSNGNKVEIEILSNKKHFSMKISDNGNVGKINGSGLGLISMRQRAKSINGRLEIDKLNGFVVKFEVDLFNRKER